MTDYAHARKRLSSDVAWIRKDEIPYQEVTLVDRASCARIVPHECVTIG